MKNIVVIIFLVVLSSKAKALGCNFGITNTVIVGATHSYTIGQGPWGIRKYTWNYSDGSPNVITYSNSNNITFATHTFTMNGSYTMSITACDSASGAGCISYGNFVINVTGANPTGIYENNNFENITVFPVIFTDKIEIKNGLFNKIELRNSLGVIIRSESFETTTNRTLYLDNLSRDIYYLYIYEDKKLVKIVRSVRL